MAGTPEMQEHFPAGAGQSTVPKNEVLGTSDTCRKCRSIFQRVHCRPLSRKTKPLGYRTLEIREQSSAIASIVETAGYGFRRDRSVVIAPVEIEQSA